MISIKGLDKVEVLRTLYESARPQAFGQLLHVPGRLPRNEAEYLLSQQGYFDYVKGRVLKVDLSKDEFDPRLYDRDNGEGAALAAITRLKA